MTCSHQPRLFDGKTLAAGDLSTGQRLVLWGVRHWVACLRDETDSWEGLSQVFAHYGATDAAFSLHGLMQLTRRATTRPVDVRCPVCADVSPDERRILAAVTAAQHGDSEAAAVALAGWLPPTAVRFAIAMAEGLARMLVRAGLPMPAPQRPHPATPVRPPMLDDPLPMASTAIH